ncbi:MAG: DUF4190 domain-containing protein [Treponemataceae bacterium]
MANAKTFIQAEFSRSGANLLKLGIPFAVIGASLVSAAVVPGRLPAMASALAWGLIFLSIGCVFLVRRIVRGGAEAAFLKQVGAFGAAETAAAEIEEGSLAAGRVEHKKLAVFGRWAIIRKTFSTLLFPLDELMWLYRNETQNYVNGIKTGKEIAIKFVLRSGGVIKLPLRNALDASDLSAAVSEKAPWAIAGYTMALEELWKRDRAAWIAEVDKRKENPEPSPAPAPDAERTLSRNVPSYARAPRSGLVFGLGLASLFVPLPLGVVAAVLGIIDKTDEAKGRLEPRKLTTAGIVLGIFGTLFQGVIFALMFFSRRGK